MEDNAVDPKHTSGSTSKKTTAIIVIAVFLSLALSFWLYAAQKQKNTASQMRGGAQADTSPDQGNLDTTAWKGFAGVSYAAKYPTELQTKSNEIKPQVLLDTWTPPDAGYSMFVVSYPKNTDPNIKFITTRDVVKQVTVAGQRTTRVKGYSNTGTVIHIGPILVDNTNYLLIYDSGKNKATPESIQIFDTLVSTFTPNK